MKRLLTVVIAIVLMAFACNKTRTAAPLSKHPEQPNPRLTQIEDSANEALLKRILIAEAQLSQLKMVMARNSRIHVMSPMEPIHGAD